MSRFNGSGINDVCYLYQNGQSNQSGAKEHSGKEKTVKRFLCKLIKFKGKIAVMLRVIFQLHFTSIF